MISSVFDISGCRKYLNQREIHDILASASNSSVEVHAFCRLLAETGCRISEALDLQVKRIDTNGPCVVFECLKKRQRGVFRQVPISRGLAKLLLSIETKNVRGKIWGWSRTTAWRHVRQLLVDAAVSGPQACPKGFRHGFAVAALGAGAPLNLVQRWLGHADIQTTSIYAAAVGPEEREIVARIWYRHQRGAKPASLRSTAAAKEKPFRRSRPFARDHQGEVENALEPVFFC